MSPRKPVDRVAKVVGHMWSATDNLREAAELYREWCRS
jgi:hypothetical protein